MERYAVVVIAAGPGGYPAAMRAARQTSGILSQPVLCCGRALGLEPLIAGGPFLLQSLKKFSKMSGRAFESCRKLEFPFENFTGEPRFIKGLRLNAPAERRARAFPAGSAGRNHGA